MTDSPLPTAAPTRPAGRRGGDDDQHELLDLLGQVKGLIAQIERRLKTVSGEPAPVTDAHPVITWRKRRGMTQADLAHAVGLTPPAIWRIENSPGLACRKDTRDKLAEVLDVPVEWLVYNPS